VVEQLIDRRRRWRAACEVYRQERANAWIKPEGRSMRPLIGPGTWALVEFGAAPAAVGEIVLFGRGDMVIAHRLVAWRPGRVGLIAKGDAEANCDMPLNPSDILGVVRALRRGPDGLATRVGCAGLSARMIASASLWLGRGAALARRGATLLPDPLRRLALRAIPPFTRVAALALFAPVWWAAQIQAVRTHGDERR
jgi:Peptidase S24-like